MNGIEEIKQKLQAFKKKYYQRQLLLGILLFLILSSSLFLLANSIEYRFWLGVTARSFIFYLLIITNIGLLVNFIVRPVSLLLKLRNGLSDESAALEIQRSFPEVEDKLLNTLQLSKLGHSDSELLAAAIEKKAKNFGHISFVKAVDFKKGKRYGVVLLIIFLGFAFVSFINPSIIKDGSKRIINHTEIFTPKAPFEFNVPTVLEAFRGEDFVLQVLIEGSAVPEKVYLKTNGGRSIKLINTSATSFSYNFSNIQSPISFQLEGSGFYSKRYMIDVYDRPDLIAMNIQIQNPGYTGGDRKLINNSGNLTVLEGSSVNWEILTLSTDSLDFQWRNTKIDGKQLGNNTFGVSRRVFESGQYEISLHNEYGKNNSALQYNVEVIKDQRPTISAEYFPDSVLYKYITVAGNIVDDHGFSSLELIYTREGEEPQSIPIELTSGIRKQGFYVSWNIDSLSLQPSEQLEFYINVKDNDGVNGPKSSRSRTFLMTVPDRDQIDKLIDKKSELVENQIDTSKKNAEEINELLEDIEERLKSEQDFDWQEKKQLDKVLEDREKLEEQIKELQEKHEDLKRSSDQFNKRSESLKQKDEQLQQLFEELMDEKTRELYEQLKELLKQNNPSSDQVRQQLQDIQRNEKNLEKELDRALELFKRLKMESALEENLQMLDSLSSTQQELAKKKESQQGESSIKDEQKEIQEGFEKFREKMDEVEELNQQLKRPEPLKDFELEERQIAKELREIEEMLEEQAKKEEGQNSQEQTQESQSQENTESNDENMQGSQENQQQSKSSNQNQQRQQKQKNAGQKMKQLSQQLSNMQAGMQMEMMQANLDQLRDILDNLVKLSFNQESLMLEMREVSQSDPRFLELSQAQLKLKDDAKVIQDSLLSLAERVVQLSSFITREVGNINENIDEALDFLKDRNRGRALSSQQFAMTSINNLALLLDDTMQQMQMAMSEAMGNPGQSQQQQKGLPDLQQMQQSLGDKIDELKESGKQGRELSEELAQLAAEQEMIRRQLEMIKEAEEGKPGGNTSGDDLQRAIKQMEQNEIDLVNKRLTQQLINRQQGILTRMLKAEKAQREQELEEEREAESPSSFSREIPPQFEEYLKMKQKEIELLKTIPVELNPFYKKEVNDYFRRISTEYSND